MPAENAQCRTGLHVSASVTMSLLLQKVMSRRLLGRKVPLEPEFLCLRGMRPTPVKTNVRPALPSDSLAEEGLKSPSLVLFESKTIAGGLHFYARTEEKRQIDELDSSDLSAPLRRWGRGVWGTSEGPRPHVSVRHAPPHPAGACRPGSSLWWGRNQPSCLLWVENLRLC